MIALEGNCYAGKTTLANELATRLHGAVVPEYADLAPLPPFPPPDHRAVHEAIDYLAQVEAHRASLAAAVARRSGEALVFADRSPVSCIAFQYAVAALDVASDHHYAATQFASLARAGRACLPAAYIYLRIDRALLRTRQRRRGPVMACLTDQRVLDRLDHVYKQHLTITAPRRRLVLDAGQSLASLVTNARDFIKDAPRGAHPSAVAATWTGLATRLGPTGSPRDRHGPS